MDWERSGSEFSLDSVAREEMTNANAPKESSVCLNSVPPLRYRSATNFCSSRVLLALVGVGSMLSAAVWTGYSWGSRARPPVASLPIELLHASATHSSTSMAVATGRIDQESEGVFFLDYLTGDLQCWVFYPRTGQFGAKYTTNVTAQLPGGKNAEYVMVTGSINVPQAGGNARLANTLVYVVDSRAGVFAAYGVPWNRSMENSGQPQLGQLVPVGGGQIRAPGGGVAQPQPQNPANPANPPD